MASTTALTETVALVGDPARADMLTALMDERALTASELARTGSATPKTASGHLARLAGAGLLAVERQNRHCYHRLASPGVAWMLEGIMAVAEVGPGSRHRTGRMARLAARTGNTVTPRRPWVGWRPCPAVA